MVTINLVLKDYDDPYLKYVISDAGIDVCDHCLHSDEIKKYLKNIEKKVDYWGYEYGYIVDLRDINFDFGFNFRGSFSTYEWMKIFDKIKHLANPADIAQVIITRYEELYGTYWKKLCA